jgi:hypothetical protein
MTNTKNPKNPNEFICVECDFNSSNKKDYKRHLVTRKHIILTNPNYKTPIKPQLYLCNCGKSYKHASSLCGHKTKCNFKKQEQQELTPKEDIQKEDNKDNIINLLVTDNKEMRDMFLMFIKNHSESQEDMTKKMTAIFF